jgi:hypothetical protein
MLALKYGYFQVVLRRTLEAVHQPSHQALEPTAAGVSLVQPMIEHKETQLNLHSAALATFMHVYGPRATNMMQPPPKGEIPAYIAKLISYRRSMHMG